MHILSIKYNLNSLYKTHGKYSAIKAPFTSHSLHTCYTYTACDISPYLAPLQGYQKIKLSHMHAPSPYFIPKYLFTTKFLSHTLMYTYDTYYGHINTCTYILEKTHVTYYLTH